MSITKYSLLVCGLLLTGQGALAQWSAAPIPVPRGSFTFRYENDFFNATDKYYTQGIVLEYAASGIGASPIAPWLLHLSNATATHSLFAEQNCFTPSSIRRDTIFTGDRPFAAALFIGERSESVDPQRALKLGGSLTVGVLGPCASCAAEQRGIHNALNNIEPLGWQFQVCSDVIVNYAAHVEKRVLRLRFLETSLGAGAAVGTYRTNASLGGRVELGHFRSSFDAPSLARDGFRASLFLDGRMRVIGYDASMQGGLFNTDSPYVLDASAIERIVLAGGGGVRLSYRSLILTYAKTFITREYVGGADHGWGTCTIKVLF